MPQDPPSPAPSTPTPSTPTPSTPAADPAKDAAARAAVLLVESGMRLGLGTGSTARIFVDRLAQRVRDEGLALRCAATSQATAAQARALGLVVEDLDDLGWLDLTIDGADELDADLNLIKGGGAAHLREKIVATASDRMVVIADQGKVVDRLGRFPLPVEVIGFGWTTTRTRIARALDGLGLGGRALHLRHQPDGRPVVTDEGNLILDLALERIPDAAELAGALCEIAGVVEHGLFLDICRLALIGCADGSVVELKREDLP